MISEPKSSTSEKPKDLFQQPGFKKRIISAGLETIAFLGLTIVFKISAGKALNIKDDVRNFYSETLAFFFNLLSKILILGPHL
jgi:hypothetical protein